MNRQGPGKIDWTNYTWNPVTGCYGPGGSCGVPNHCPYCYAKRMYERLGHSFEPAFHAHQLLRPGKIKKPSKIFVCSVGELFGDWVPDSWIEQVLYVVRINPQHTFQFLTKWPDRLPRWNPWPDNAWVGATATDQEAMEAALSWLPWVQASVLFVSAEPLLGPIEVSLLPLDWLIVGSMTGPGARKPQREWVERLVGQAVEADTPVWMKDNLCWENPRQEWPLLAAR